ncbi:MAG TPA: type II toxin-antitoxin system RatA family toxin [Alphaproteobacteria bacterium]|nr:type II toxin-antitoxin system RatA family toxin [Alphaproteobacteria bacterium]HNS45014.1 type II toxin-antitoxin system RatA family toxin [Alphaproteobacteria bacterium]
MPIHTERKILPYSASQMFDLVMDVEKYPDYLPWCLDCRVLKKGDGFILANLVIGYKLFREWFTSKVTFEPSSTIHVDYVSGPLRHLTNDWTFTDNGDGTCTVDFYVDFEFKNPVFEKLVGVFFAELVKRMVGSFVIRAEAIYGIKK